MGEFIFGAMTGLVVGLLLGIWHGYEIHNMHMSRHRETLEKLKELEQLSDQGD